MYYVYILKCNDDSLYTGITTNPERRLAAHNAGNASKYTRGRRPVEMVYKEKASNRSEAQRRESEIKSMPRSAKLGMILRGSDNA